LILLCDPNYLWDVGFQLSYCALFFIVWLQPLIQQLWEPKYLVMRYFWNLTTVSIAAQLGTLPLSFYYFHQFPGLFLVSNWLILPPLGLLLLLGFLLCIFAYANVFWEPLTNAVQWSVEQMNGVIHWVAQHEKFVIQDIPMQLPSVILHYAFVFSVVHFIQKRNLPNFCWLILLLLGLQCNWMVIECQNSKEELVVYNVRKQHFITWKHNREIDTLGNNSPIEKPLDNYRLANAFAPKVIRKSPIQRLYCNGQKIVIIDKRGIFPIQPVDYIVLTQNPKCHLHHWLETHPVKGVIADGSSSNSLKKLWKQSCKKLKIPFHDTNEKGPFIL
jgi:competence protein ComEC